MNPPIDAVASRRTTISDVISHSLRKTPAATTAGAKAKLPHSDSATSARRDHHTDRQPRPVATAAARAITPSADDDVEERVEQWRARARRRGARPAPSGRPARPGAAAPAPRRGGRNGRRGAASSRRRRPGTGRRCGRGRWWRCAAAAGWRRRTVTRIATDGAGDDARGPVDQALHGVARRPRCGRGDRRRWLSRADQAVTASRSRSSSASSGTSIGQGRREARRHHREEDQQRPGDPGVPAQQGRERAAGEDREAAGDPHAC